VVDLLFLINVFEKIILIKKININQFKNDITLIKKTQQTPSFILKFAEKLTKLKKKTHLIKK